MNNIKISTAIISTSLLLSSYLVAFLWASRHNRLVHTIITLLNQ